LKIGIVAIGLLTSFTASAQTPDVKEVFAAYCFGALSTRSHIAEDKTDAAFDRSGTARSVDARKSQIIRYLTERGFPQRQELRDAVVEGAADMDHCVSAHSPPAKMGVDQSPSSDETRAYPRQCSLVDTCSNLSWLSR
jgi:hypothetical protein